MIYAIREIRGRGHKKPLLAKDKPVFKTAEEAVEGLNLRKYRIYGVLADWNKDTHTGKYGNRVLRRPAQLVRVPQPPQKIKWIYMVTGIKFGYEYTDAETSPDGRYHSYRVRTKKTQKRHFTITDKRLWGWFQTLKDAKEAVANNWSDMYEEGSYPEVVIEEVGEGLLSYETYEWWYKWKNGGYKPWKKPKSYRNIVGFFG